VFHKILVALDGSDASRKALQLAIETARIHEATLHALGVEEKLPHHAATVGEVEEAKEELDTFFSQAMVEARRVVSEHGLDLTTEVRAGDAAQQILLAAREGGFDLIVLGAKGHSVIRDFLLGTTTDRVTHHAPCSVLIVR
jgi:nucleotide-binding universal stress UspA family protein